MSNHVEKLNTLYEMQTEANNLTNGSGWVDGFTEVGLETNWCRCMRFELVEAIDQSFNWKHWKSTKNGQYSYTLNKDGSNFGLHNVKIELVDVLHFLMSEIIRQEWIQYLNPLFEEIMLIEFSPAEGKPLIDKLESLERNVFLYEDDNTFDNMSKLFRNFWKTILSVMSFDEIYEMYVLKNTLNIFRQKNGYQIGIRKFDEDLGSGKYVKNWGKDEIEDNVFLEKYLKNNGEVNYESIYNYLTVEYNELNK